MTYEEYLDEVTTLIVEKYHLADAAAIKLVVAAQDAEFFVKHDEDQALRNIDQAHKDAKTLYSAGSAAQKAPKNAPGKPRR
ncbi:hypothetical protein ASD15_18470 [Massilia sp. Root351]|uniref:hypothetical protein n=1 Tax=Massilia sp. Root351 TaxID=1736522 RepID=UPI00070973D8|nr:hypothetical protein [Massilia sp. Root351]KQV79572.1 hypothetical protein ASD15_18470 [Massilia sp. Root351]